jgi:hypothetical protein
MAAPLILVMLICLILTKSRSAYIALLVAVGILPWRSRRQVPARLLLGAGVAGCVVVALLVTAGLATGRLDREVLTQSPLSLGYRWEYWQGTWRMITGGASDWSTAVKSATFWSGVGPGNFRGPYLRYKLPESSEEILDPHNLFLEVWVTGGFWALLALMAALGLGLWELFGPPVRSGVGKRIGRSPPEDRRSRRSTAPAEPAFSTGDDMADTAPSRPTWLIPAAGAGWILVILLGQLNPFEGDLFPRWLILGGSWLAAVFLGGPLWRRLPIPASVSGPAVAAVLIVLLAAGGIGIPTVALGLWSLMALGLNLRDDRPCSRLRVSESRVPSFSLTAVWAAILGLFLGAVMPYWQAEAAAAEAEEAMDRPMPSFERAENACKRAVEADRYYARPWLVYARFEQLAWEWRGARLEDLRWKKIPILWLEAITPPRNPNAWTLHLRRADAIRGLLRRIGSKLPPTEVVRLGGDIVKDTLIATLLYPSNAMLHARLAEASAEISMFGVAVNEAEAALRLDQLTPHLDKKLPSEVRRRLEAQLSDWREKPPGPRLDSSPS